MGWRPSGGNTPVAPLLEQVGWVFLLAAAHQPSLDEAVEDDAGHHRDCPPLVIIYGRKIETACLDLKMVQNSKIAHFRP